MGIDITHVLILLAITAGVIQPTVVERFGLEAG